MTNRALMDKSMSEEDFAGAVVDLALSCGWKVKREPPWRPACRKHDSAVGFPDLVLVRDGRLIFAELKAEKAKKPSEAQLEWIDALEHHDTRGIMQEHHYGVFVWRPSDWDEIEEVLR